MTAKFIQSVINASVNITTANPGRDGTGVVGTLYPAAADVRIDDIQIKARSTTTTGMIRFFLHDGTTYRFLFEVIVGAAVPSATVMAFEQKLTGLAIMLQNLWSTELR